MRIYKVGSDGEVIFEGEGGGVAIRNLGLASPALLAEVLQQTYEAGMRAQLENDIETLRATLTSMPYGLTPLVRSNVRPDTEENWNRR